MNEPTNPKAGLLAKLHRVYETVRFVEKRGRNQHHDYSYAQALDVVRDVRAALMANGVVVIPAAHSAHHELIGETRGGSKVYLTTVELTYTFCDVETGAEVSVPWVGTGVDQGGDKGLYKAYTGGLKYALLSLFLLPMTDDPEHDALTWDPAPVEEESTVDKDADRPPAPLVPRDRAAAMYELAQQAGLVLDNGDFTPVLKAQLATMGVRKIGALNVDQAEDFEVFLGSELAAMDEAEGARS